MNYFNPSIKELTLADKMLRWSKEKRRFEITVNKKYMLDWAAALFLISALLFLCISLPVFFLNVIAGYITLLIPAAFILAGIRFYYLAGNDDRKIIIDGPKNVIVYSTKLAIPFRSIKQLSLMETDIFLVKNRMRIKKQKGFQIMVEDHKGNKAPLVKSENHDKIQLTLKEFSLLMGVAKKTGV